MSNRVQNSLFRYFERTIEVINMSESKPIGLSKEESHTSTVRAEDVTGKIKAKESQSLTFNVGLFDTDVVENTKIAVQEHTIFVGGTELSDQKELETVQIPGVGKISTLRHTRKIGDQQYTVIEKRVNNQVRSTETITPMTPKEVLAFKEKWQIMWHPEMTEEEILDQMDQEKILDQFEQEEHIIGEPKIHNKVEAMPTPQEPRTSHEESMKEAEPEKKKNKFWCCC